MLQGQACLSAFSWKNFLPGAYAIQVATYLLCCGLFELLQALCKAANVACGIQQNLFANPHVVEAKDPAVLIPHQLTESC